MIRVGGRRVFLDVRASTLERRRAIYKEAREVIRRRHGEPELSLVSVAREIATSRRQLQRARMRRAAELLLEGSQPVQSVAAAVGYRQAAQFAKVFRRHHGAAPSTFRRSAALAA